MFWNSTWYPRHLWRARGHSLRTEALMMMIRGGACCSRGCQSEHCPCTERCQPPRPASLVWWEQPGVWWCDCWSWTLQQWVWSLDHDSHVWTECSWCCSAHPGCHSSHHWSTVNPRPQLQHPHMVPQSEWPQIERSYQYHQPGEVVLQQFSRWWSGGWRRGNTGEQSPSHSSTVPVCSCCWLETSQVRSIKKHSKLFWTWSSSPGSELLVSQTLD